METKCNRSDILTEKNIFDQVIEQSIDADFTLPEYLPEISRVLKCSATPMLISKSVEGSALSVDGEVCVTVIYSGNSGSINSFEYVIPFSKTVELPQTHADYVKVRLKTNYLNYRPTGKRKMDVHGAVGISVCAVCNEGLPVVTDLCGKGVEVLKENVTLTCPCGHFEKSIIIDEELPLPDGSDPITSIIRYKAVSSISDCKIISGKIVAKGDVEIHILYFSEKSDCCRLYDTSIPFSQIIDAPGTDDDCQCDTSVSVASVELNPRTNLSGEVTSLTLEAKLCISADTCCEQNLSIVTDTFSTQHEGEYKTKNVCYSKLCDTVEEKFVCKKTLEFTEGSLSKVADMWCEIQTGPVKQGEDGYSVSGTVTVCVLGYDRDQTAVYFEKPLDFSYPCKILQSGENITVKPMINICESSYSFQDSDRLEVRVELLMKCKVFCDSKVCAVTEVSFDEQSKKVTDKGFSLAIYYTSTDEKIWNIAKRYNTSVQSIMQANELASDEISSGRMLLIPCI